jgi:ATP-dependent DNA helicase RecG
LLAPRYSNFSKSAVQEFITNSSANFSYPSNDFNQWAVSFGLAEESKKEVTPTNMGMILFGEKVDELLPHTIFKVEIEYPNGSTEIEDFGGPVSTQLRRVFDYVSNKALKLTIDRTSAKRISSADFPLDILREAIANAIIHRDYSITSSTNYLFINSDIIVIKSPGLPMPPLTLADIRTLDLPSVSRNPKVMYVYNRMGLAEQRGIGLRSMKSLSEKGFPLPVINLKGNVLELAFARSADALSGVIASEISGLSTQDKEGIQFIQANEPITVNDYAEKFGITAKTAQRRLSDLVDKGLIIKEGERRWTKYRLKN